MRKRERIGDVRDRRLEFQAVHLRGKLPRGGDELLAGGRNADCALVVHELSSGF